MFLSLLELCSSKKVQIRLVGGTKSEGNVQVLYKGEWRYVCDDKFDIRDAKVVCRQLGFARAVEFTVKYVNIYSVIIYSRLLTLALNLCCT